MDRKAISPFNIRITGAIIGSTGFFLVAYKVIIWGTALVGIGSILIAAGEG